MGFWRGREVLMRYPWGQLKMASPYGIKIEGTITFRRVILFLKERGLSVVKAEEFKNLIFVNPTAVKDLSFLSSFFCLSYLSRSRKRFSQWWISRAFWLSDNTQVLWLSSQWWNRIAFPAFPLWMRSRCRQRIINIQTAETHTLHLYAYRMTLCVG